MTDQPYRPCVVCFDPPGRVVSLAGVTGASVPAGVCDTCAERATAGDVTGLSGRALRGWTDEYRGTVPDAARALLARAGHATPPAPAPSDAPPLTPADGAQWSRIAPLMADGPDRRVTVSGEISYDTAGEPSVTTGVFVDGPRTRLLGGSGAPWLISDGVVTWRLTSGGMLPEPCSQAWAGHGSELAARRRREDVELFGFGTPVGPIEQVERLGRQAWEFRLAAPAHKPSDLRIVVDRLTGLVLEKQFADRSIARWTEFRTDVPLSDELFTGPTTAG